MIELEARVVRHRAPMATRRWLPIPVPPAEVDEIGQSLDARMTPEWERVMQLLAQPETAYTETNVR